MSAPIAIDSPVMPVKPNGIFVPKSPKQFAVDLYRRIRPEEQPNLFVVQLERQADLKQIAELPRGPERRQAAWQALAGTAQLSQKEFAPKIDVWKKDGLIKDMRHHALGNIIEFEVPREDAKEFQRRLKLTKGIAHFERLDPYAKPEKPTPEPKKPPSITEQTIVRRENDGPKDATTFESKYRQAWHLWQSGVRDLRKQGFTGKGVTVGVLDTGVDIDHPNLRHAWRQGDKKQNWLPADQKKDYKKDVPFDMQSHGTHVAGIIVGNDPKLRTGMAPDAKLMVGSMFDDSLFRQLDWFLAPGEGDFTSPKRDATKGADILSNSWGFVGPDGARFGKLMSKPFQQLNDAGVVTVFAAGNSGPAFGTVLEPGIRQSVITVGASERDGTIASFSSRDKARRAESRLKPDIVAPGHPIPSSVPDGEVDDQLAMVGAIGWILGGAVPEAAQNGPIKGMDGAYWNLSGTSMATPLVSGALATILQAYPQLDTDDLKGIVQRSAIDMGRKGPEAMYGHGRLDLPKAMLEAAKVAKDKYGVVVDKPYKPTKDATYPIKKEEPADGKPKRGSAKKS